MCAMLHISAQAVRHLVQIKAQAHKIDCWRAGITDATRAIRRHVEAIFELTADPGASGEAEASPPTLFMLLYLRHEMAMSHDLIALRMNQMGIRTERGKQWTAANVRRALRTKK